MKDQSQESSDSYTENEIYDIRICENTRFYGRKEDCRSCEDFVGCSDTYLSYYIKFPFFIIDNYMTKKKLSHSAFIVFLYICRRVDFKKNSNHFGRCWLSLTIISEATGIKVSNMRKYLNELKKIGMISWGYTRRKDDDGYKTTHEFKVTHLKLLEELKREGSKLFDEWKKNKSKKSSKPRISTTQ